MKQGKKKNRIIVLLLTLALALSVGLGISIFAAETETAEPPAHSKNLTDNGDGTYTLSLSVTGKATKSEEQTKANVVIVMDISGSMNFHEKNPTGSMGITSNGSTPWKSNIIQLYKRSISYYGDYIYTPLTDDEAYTGNLYYRSGNSYYSYSSYGDRYNSKTRLDVEKEAINTLIDNLAANNKADNPDIVEVSFVTFAQYANPRTATGIPWYSGDMSDLKTRVSNITATGGTNWDDGLHVGKAVLDAKKTQPGQSSEDNYVVFISDGNPTYYMQKNHTELHGNGNDTRSYELNAAYSEAESINNAGYGFYGVGVFGNVSNMEELCRRAGADNNYYEANDEEAVKRAFDDVVNSINSASTYKNVKITDGITQLTSSSMSLANVDTNSFTYTVSNGEAYTGPSATYANNTVTWDLGSQYEVKDGVTYTVSFKVWPSQAAYDLIAQLNNGIKTYDSLSSDEKKQITKNDDGTYTLKTNTDNSLDYTQVLTKESKNKPDGYREGQPADDGYTYTYDSNSKTYKGTKTVKGKTTGFTNPEGMVLAGTKISVDKSWIGGWEPEEDDAEVKFNLLADGVVVKDVNNNPFVITLTKDNNWSKEVYIAPGLISGGKTLEAGHNYTLREVDTDYHVEFSSGQFHPMLDNSSTVIKDANGSTTNSLVGTNTRKSSLSISKVVNDLSADVEVDPNQLFTYKIKVKDSDSSDGKVWFSIGNGNTPKNVSSENRVEGATSTDEHGLYYAAANDSEVTVKIKANENIYFANLTSKSTYSVEEVDIPSGFANTNITNTGGDVAVATHKATGNVAKASQSYKVVYTNTFDAVTVSDMSVTKKVTGRDATEQFAFTLNGNAATKKAIKDGDIKVAEGADSAETVTQGNIKKDGTEKVSFGEYTFYKEGTYVFTADETTTTTAGGWTYDNSTKNITVKVVKGSDGKLKATVEGNNPTFTNKYEVKPTEFTLGASKTLLVESGNNKPDVKEKYTLKLKGVGNAPMPSETEVNNPDGEGTAVNFGTITFTEAGEYSYTVSEEGTVPGVSNGTASYGVTIKVEDQGDGTLKATVKTGSKITNFNNTYRVGSASVDLSASKVLKYDEGLTPPDVTGKYTLTIEAVTANAPMPATTSVNNKDGNGGTQSFGTITYTVPGTYEYKIKESGSVPGVTNDPEASTGKTVKVIVTDLGDGSMSAEVEGGSSNTVFTNTYSVNPATINLGASKMLEVKSGNNAPDVTGKYDLKISAKTEGAPLPSTKTFKNADGNETAKYFGDITFTKPGTYTYTVSESGTVAGVKNGTTSYDVTVNVVDNRNGTMTASVADGSNQVTKFTNTYSVDPVNFELKAGKKLEVKSGDNAPDVSGRYTLAISPVDGAPMPNNPSFTNEDGNGKVTSFGEIKFTAPGTYKYKVTETGTVTGVTNGKSSYDIEITVTDNGAGMLEANITKGSEETIFTNTYEAKPAKITLGASKTLTSDKGLTPPDVSGKYDLSIEAVTEGAPMPENATVTNPDGNGGKIDFSEITFTEPGTYEYKISEELNDESIKGITNDEAAAGKNVVVTVTDDGKGQLEAAVTSGSQVTNFTNTYSVKETTLNLGASKKLEAAEGLNKPDISGKYALSIVATTEGAPLPPVTTVENPDGAGTAVFFGDITFTKPGTYTYEVSESGGVTGVQNGQAKYSVIVTVADNRDGTLTANITAGNTVTAFTNTYTVGKATIDLSAGKKLEVISGNNAPDVAGKYTLSIKAKTKNAPMPERTSFENADGNGTYTSFGTITFDKPGEYTYTISEAGDVPGVTNGTTSYDVTVVVTDHGNGEMTAAMKEGSIQSVLFTNTYSVEPTTITLGASKTLEVKSGNNAPDVSKKYDLKLTPVDGAPMPDEDTTVNNPDGAGTTVDFGTITYTAPGTYKYTVSENLNDPDIKGITDDSAAAGKEVEVTVKDDGKGNLSADVTKGARYTNFKNTYSVTPTSMALNVAKKLEAAEGLTAPDVSGKYDLSIEAITEGAPMPAKTTVQNADGSETPTSFGAIEFTAPGTYKYKVTESGNVAGVENDPAANSGKEVEITVTDKGNGKLEAKVTSGSQTTVFTNTYSVKPITYKLGASKTLDAADGLNKPNVKDAYDLKIEAKDGAPAPEKSSVKNPDGNGTAEYFSDIEFTAPGVYEYEVSESGDVKGVTNDPKAGGKKVIVTVTDKSNGELKAEVTSGAKVTNFTNTYGVAPTTFTLGASKTLKVTSGNNAPDVSGKYDLVLESVGNSPMPEKSSVKNPDGKGTAENFGEITFTAPGEYKYTVSERGGVKGVSNGQNQYSVTVKVTDNGDGTLTPEVTDGDKITNFTNTYSVGEASIEISAGKLLNVASGNNAPDVSKKYDLAIEAVTEKAPMPATTSFKNDDGNGTAKSFGPIKFTKPGTYIYRVTESGTVAGVTNGTSSYSVTVTVSDNGDGTLTPAVTSGSATVIFTNTYSVKPANINLGASKTLEVKSGNNAPDVSEKYDLTIAAKSEGAPLPSNTSIKNADGTGTARYFGDITFTAPGKYTYTISESGTVEGVTNGTSSYEVEVTVTDDSKGNLNAAVTGGSRVTAFTNSYSVEKTSIELSAAKKLEAAEGLTPPDVSGEYDLSIEAVTAGAPMPAQTSVKNADGNSKATSFGAIEFTKPGTYKYKVTESGNVAGVENDPAAKSGKEVVVTVTDDGRGNLEAKVTSGSQTTVFTNTYGVAPTTFTLGASKTLKAADGLKKPNVKDAYDLKIEAKNGAPAPEKSSVKNPDGDGTAVYFSDIEFTAPGVYEYEVSESGEVDGVTNDPKADGKKVVVTVTDKSNGELKAEVTSGAKVTNFTNTYSVAPTTFTLGAAKSLVVESGDQAPDVSGKYDLSIVAKSEGAPMPADTTSFKNADGNGTAKYFGDITFTAPGKYTYTISESGTVVGVTNGTSSYDVTVTVTDKGDGTLEANVTDGKEVTTFINKYAVGALIVNADFAEKKVEGEDFASKKFTFTMTECDEKGTPLENATPVAASLMFDQAGTKDIDFGTLTYNNVGTHYYLVKETNIQTAGDGWTYDLEPRIVKVSVTDNGKGELHAEISDKVTITNSYKAAPVTVDPTEKKFGQKEVKGTGFDEKTFNFTMTEVQDANGTAKAGAKSEDARLTFDKADTKTIEFSELTFTEKGTYYYKLDETNGDGDGWTCDKNEPVITINVTDNGNGKLVAEVSGQSKFTNSYRAASTSVTLDAKKVLKNLKLRDGQFNFELVDEATNEVIDTKQNNAKGTVTFDELTYDEVGTHNYIIREKLPEGVDANKPELNGIKYDTHEAKVKITVTDNGTGKLVATPEISGSTTFTNTYEAEGGSNVVGLKVLKDKELKEGDFTFTITGDGPLPEKTEVTNGANGIIDFGAIKFSLKDLGIDDDAKTDDAKADEAKAEDKKADEPKAEEADTSDAGKAEAEATDAEAGNADEEATTDDSSADEAKAEDGAIAPADDEATDNDEDAPRTKTFTYTVHETGHVPGVKNDSDKTFKIQITDEGNGNIKAELLADDSMAFTFTNEFTPAEVEVGATKKFIDAKTEADIWSDSKYSSETFKFEIAPVGNAPMTDKNGDNIKTSITTTSERVSDVFGKIAYDKPGTYQYKITEKKGSADKVIYDTLPRTVTVTVVQDEKTNALSATTEFAINTKNADIKASDVTMVNRAYDKIIPGEGAKAEIEVTKMFSEWDLLEEGEGFTFELAAVDGAPMPKKNGAVQNTVTATEANKTAVFNEIEYEAPGVYNYTLTEVDTHLGGVTYDTTPHKVVVTVRQLEDKSYLTFVEYDEEPELTIENPYESLVVKALEGIQVTKKYDKWTDNDQFVFTLSPVDDAPMPMDADGNIRSTGYATKQDKVAVFGDIEYKKVGEYKYFITEENTGRKDVKYDTAKHSVTVTVTADEETNKLLATITYDDNLDSLTIVNTYKKGKNPKTGDDQPVLPYAGAMGLALAGLGVMARRRYRKEDR